ncbi:glycosyltransferase family 2 protein [Sciscionella sediminilitoris]|uniref:glycosyltransferase family 2 protein n=1 Tax=Sciscionella sediminilitoris TaxID=1445613 RepID=UPI0004DF033C|nr:glycosyltransferase [Sciscionella sp. SE31]
MSELTSENQPEIDILLPFYGDVALMREAVHSVLAQDTGGWRLTVVDDGDAEGVPEWFDSLADERVRYFRNPRNLGVTGNFQRCLELAEYERVTLLGTDDLLAPNYVRTVRAAAARHEGIGMIQPGVEVIDEHGEPATGLADAVKHRIYAPRVREELVLGGEPLAASLLRGNWLYFPSLSWRTEAITAIGFRSDLRTTQDLALELDLIERGERLLVLTEACFKYRRHGASVSSTMATDGDRFREERALFQETARRFGALGWRKAARAARVHSGSRLHALTQVPGAALGKDRAVLGTLLRHAVTNR